MMSDEQQYTAYACPTCGNKTIMAIMAINSGDCAEVFLQCDGDHRTHLYYTNENLEKLRSVYGRQAALVRGMKGWVDVDPVQMREQMEKLAELSIKLGERHRSFNERMRRERGVDSLVDLGAKRHEQ